MKKLKLEGREMLSKEQMKKIAGGEELYDAGTCCYPNFHINWCYSKPASWAEVVLDVDYFCPSNCGAGHPVGWAPWDGVDCW